MLTQLSLLTLLPLAGKAHAAGEALLAHAGAAAAGFVSAAELLSGQEVTRSMLAANECSRPP